MIALSSNLDNMKLRDPERYYYILKGLVQHLSQSYDFSRLLELFSTEEWMQARFKYGNSSYDDYAADASLSFSATSQHSAPNETVAELSTRMSLCFRLCLIISTLNSLASHTFPELIVRALELCIPEWTIERAVSEADRLTDPKTKCEFYLLLLSSGLLDDKRERDITSKAISAVMRTQDIQSCADLLFGLRPYLTNSLFETTLHEIKKICMSNENPEIRARTRAKIAQCLEANEANLTISYAIQDVQLIDSDAHFNTSQIKAFTVCHIASMWRDDYEPSLLSELIRISFAIDNETERCRALVGLYPCLVNSRHSNVEVVLSEILNLIEKLRSTDFVADIVDYVPSEERSRLLNGAINNALDSLPSRIGYYLSQVIPKLDTELLEHVYKKVGTFSYAPDRVLVLLELAKRFEDERRTNIMNLALSDIANIDKADKSLGSVLLRLRQCGDMMTRSQLSWLIQELYNAHEWVGSLSEARELIPFLDIPQVNELYDLVRIVPDYEQQIYALATVLEKVSSENRSRIVMEALKIIPEVREGELQFFESRRLKLLERISDHIEGEAIDLAFDLIMDSGSNFLVSLSKILPKCNSAQYKRIIPFILDSTKVKDGAKGYLLGVIVRIIDSENLSAIAGAINSLKDDAGLAYGLASLSLRLEGHEKQNTLNRAIEIASSVEDERSRATILAEISAIGSLEPEVANKIFHEAKKMSDDEDMAYVFSRVVRSLPETQVDEMLEIVSGFENEALQANVIANAAHRLTKMQLMDVMGQVEKLEDRTLYDWLLEIMYVECKELLEGAVDAQTFSELSVPRSYMLKLIDDFVGCIEKDRAALLNVIGDLREGSLRLTEDFCNAAADAIINACRNWQWR